jgi:hypothetical protein
MDYQPFHLHCKCGDVPERIEEVGLSAAQELVIHWWCGGCNRLVYTSMPLADCWNACPGAAVTVDDEQFLRRLGVCFLED